MYLEKRVRIRPMEYAAEKFHINYSEIQNCQYLVCSIDYILHTVLLLLSVLLLCVSNNALNLISKYSNGFLKFW